ncbi:MAG: 3-phosphoshikimate 1-carboxyvinyltransferase [Sporichthyaceae bacterium]
MTSPWPAPTATGPVRATVNVPGSKSVTNRALVLAALASSPTTLHGPLRSRDTTLMVAGLRALGVTIDDHGEHWVITPGPLTGPATIDVGNAGTVMRFLLPLAALADGDVHFDGDPRARERPLKPVVDVLRALGTSITSASGGLPLTVSGRGWLMGGTVTLDASLSSQFVTALLLAGPRFASGIEVRHDGERLPSGLHIAMTVEMLRAAGVLVEHAETYAWRVEPGPLHVGSLRIEPDLSNAAPFLAAAMVTTGSVTVPDWPVRTSQAGDVLRHLLERLGGRCELTPRGLTVTGPEVIKGIDVDLGDVGELTPVIAAICAFAESPSTLGGIGHLRHHETDRLAALSREITGLGGDVHDTEDGLVINPQPLRAGLFSTYDDHRLATAAAVLGLCVPGIEVEDIATTGKTLPGFVELWAEMLG